MVAKIRTAETVNRIQVPGWDEMARKKPPTKTVRVHSDVAQMIDTCAAAEGVGAPEWLSALLRPILLERLPRAVDLLLKPQDESPPDQAKKRHK